MAFKISINVKGIDKVKKLLERVPSGAKSLVARAISEYLLGDERRGLRHYAPWKKITRKRAYGVTFFSNKQQRAFFAKLRSGEINVPYRRTGAQGKAWSMVGSGPNYRLRNTDPTVKWTRGQTRLHALMGWQTAMQTVKSNLKGALAKGKAALVSYVRGK